jgi:hypothetical protein
MSTESMELSLKCVEVPTGMVKGKRVYAYSLKSVSMESVKSARLNGSGQFLHFIGT